MTKILLNKTFEGFIDTNELRIKVKRWIERT
jgi:hypothetical protein